MKVILTDDVAKLGTLNEVVEVADGYARNFLLPRSLAVPATKSAIANLDNTKRVSDRRQTRLRGLAEGVAATLSGKTVVMDAKVGSAGRLFGSISTADVAKQIKTSLGVELDKKQIELGEAIRSTGLYSVPINLHRDVKVSLLVQVGDAPAGGFPQPAAAAAPAEAETVETDA